MKGKGLLYSGLVLAAFGILLKFLTDLNLIPTILVLGGVLLKIYYLVSKIRRGTYRPGYEIGILLIGLALFLSGIYIREHGGTINPAFLMIPGIALKVTFIILFIRKLRKN